MKGWSKRRTSRLHQDRWSCCSIETDEKT